MFAQAVEKEGSHSAQQDERTWFWDRSRSIRSDSGIPSQRVTTVCEVEGKIRRSVAADRNRGKLNIRSVGEGRRSRHVKLETADRLGVWTVDDEVEVAPSIHIVLIEVGA